MRKIGGISLNVKGFIGLSLVYALVLVTLFIGSGIFAIRYFVQADQTIKTSDYMDEARRSLFVRAQVGGVLPFADLDADGKQDKDAFWANIRGGLPYVDLGLLPADEWGHRLHYHVNGGLIKTRWLSCQNLKNATGFDAIKVWDDPSGAEVSVAAVLVSAGPADADHAKDVFDALAGRGDNTDGPPYVRAQMSDSFDDNAYYIKPADLYDWLKNNNYVNQAVFNWSTCTTEHCGPWPNIVKDADEEGVNCGGNDCPPCP